MATSVVLNVNPAAFNDRYKLVSTDTDPSTGVLQMTGTRHDGTTEVILNFGVS